MITDDLRGLADRADRVEGHREARVVEVHQRIGLMRRRRRTVAASGAAAVAAIAVVTAIALRPSDERTTPAPDPTPTPSIPTPVDTRLDRPLTYAVGQTIHYGDQLIDTGRPVVQVDVTDAGVVYVTEDGDLWFTNGTRPSLIDQGHGTHDERVEVPASATGSLIAWVRSEGEQPVEVAVYDAASRRIVLNEPAGPTVWPDFDTRQPQAQAQVVTADQVVVAYSDTHYHGRDVGQIRYVSYDLDTGRRTELSYDEFDAVAVAAPNRSLGWRSRGGDPDNLLRGSTDSYQVRDGVLTVRVFDDSVGRWRIADPVDPVTGEVLRIPAPAGVADGSELRLFQWLDDGVFAMVRMVTQTDLDVGDLVVVCTLSDSRCEVAVEGRQTFVLPGREFYE